MCSIRSQSASNPSRTTPSTRICHRSIPVRPVGFLSARMLASSRARISALSVGCIQTHCRPARIGGNSSRHVEQHGGVNGCHHRESGGGNHQRLSLPASGRARAISRRDHWPTSSTRRACRSCCGFRGPILEPSRTARTPRAAGAIGRLWLQPQSCLQGALISGVEKLHSVIQPAQTRAGMARNRRIIASRASEVLPPGHWYPHKSRKA